MAGRPTASALIVTTSIWGDVDGDNALLVSDVSNIKDTVAQAPAGHLHKYQAQITSTSDPNVPDPNETVTVLNLSNVVDAVKGLGYPFTGAVPCP